MALKTTNPTKTKSWKKLQDHYKEIKDVHMKTMFSNHPERAELLSLEWEDFYLDYSKHRIDQNTIQLLTELAKEVDLSDAIEKYFSGAFINKTENRAVLHTALRADKSEEVFVDGENVIPGVQEVKSKMKTF
ncbi:MAG: glucose-6-phosphate isomerase, partial [Flavobacteriaceae bacterium]